MQSLRFNEFGRAVWELQKNFKLGGRGHDWRFACYYDIESDWGLADDVKASANSMDGQMYKVKGLGQHRACNSFMHNDSHPGRLTRKQHGIC